MFSNPVDDLLQDGDLCNESGEDADETAVGDDSTKSIDRKHGQMTSRSISEETRSHE